MKSARIDQGLFRFAAPPHRRGPRRTKNSGVPHSSRPELGPGNVVHVTVKLRAGLPSLRKGEALEIVRAAIGRVNRGNWARIVEYSIQSNHLHLLVEAANSADLSRGMASLNTGLGMRLNRIWNRVGSGSVFKERFHMTIIDSPTRMRNALRYVLRNDVHHRLGLKTLDPCSSAPSFSGWQQHQGSPAQAKAAATCVTAKPQTWLLKIGWQKVRGKHHLLSARQAPRTEGHHRPLTIEA